MIALKNASHVAYIIIAARRFYWIIQLKIKIMQFSIIRSDFRHAKVLRSAVKHISNIKLINSLKAYQLGD